MKIADVLISRSSSGMYKSEVWTNLVSENAVDRMKGWRSLESFYEICHGMATGVLVGAGYGAVGGVFV